LSRKLYYIANARLPTEKAHGYQIFQMCQAFLESGQETILLRPHRENPLKDQDPTHYYGLRQPVTIKTLWAVDLISLMGTYFPKVTRLSQAALFFHMLTYSFSLRRFFKKEKGTPILFLRDINLCAFLLFLLPRPLRSKLNVEVHALSDGDWRRARQVRILKKAARVICVTGAMKERLVALGLDEKRLQVAHDAVDIESFDIPATRDEAREKLNIPQDILVASFVGKFHTNGMEKGIPEIIWSATKLLSEFPKLHFYFIGGPLDRTIKYFQLIDELNLARDRFIFMDKQPLSLVPLFLKASDILLMPHPQNDFYAYYVSPLKLFEYMAAGRPIVASRLPSICEILEDGRNALLGKAGCPEAIAENIEKLLRHSELARKLANTARVESHSYTWRGRAGQILESI
jgi:glycosyltransferase involved in cell wall biosynthesis